MGTVNLADAKINYETFGNSNNPPLIMLHGNGEDISFFAPQISHFETDFYIIAIDSRGHGKSIGIPHDFDQMAGDTLAVMRSLNIAKAHFLGFSDGAIQALHLAMKAPENIRSLILLGANITPNGLRVSVRIYLWYVYLLLCIKTLFNPTKWMLTKIIWSLMIFHPHIEASTLKNITVPTLVIAGENDMIKLSHTGLITSSIPQSEMVIVPNVDHFLSSNKPEVFNNIAGKFLRVH